MLLTPEEVKTRLSGLSAMHWPNECDIDHDLFLPVGAVSTKIDCMAGYFSSGSLSELSCTLSTYLNQSVDNNLRLILSPDFGLDTDRDALAAGFSSDRNLLPLLFPGFSLDEETLKNESVKALAYLVASGRMEFKVAVRAKGILHTKCWLFSTPAGLVSISGSGNPTKGGLADNIEHLTLNRVWTGFEAEEIISSFRDRFDRLWNDIYPDTQVVPLNRRTIEALSDIAQSYDFSTKKAADRLKALYEEQVQDAVAVEKPSLKIPDWLNYDSGDFSHQGKAVRAWQENNGVGILSIATGGGKTLTSLVAATLSAVDTPLLVIVAVPTIALVHQWIDEIALFGGKAVCGNGITPSELKRELRNCRNNLAFSVSHVECIVMTYDALKTGVVELGKKSSDPHRVMLIADEVHNMGSPGFVRDPPAGFDLKLGLSATVERQFDELGTEFLQTYFGGEVFTFDLSEAIGKCLVPYDYYPVVVKLTVEEEDEFIELTGQIRKLAYASDLPDGSSDKELLHSKCIKRRRLIERAENKIKKFFEIVDSQPAVLSRSLIFCTDKDSSQIQSVNQGLGSRKVLFHQVTQNETSRGRLLESIVDGFNSDELTTLTSMRVLDEGFNVPRTERAFLLANSTVKRQWTQRLGRVLRLSPGTHKEKSEIYDLVALPILKEGSLDEDLRALLRSEFQRVTYFSNLSANASLPEGGLAVAELIMEMMDAR